jgi:uncharacterized protein YjbJ (UPF0337 family)
MSDSGSGRFDDIKTRLKEALGDADGEVDLDTIVARVRESVDRTGGEIDADALVARVKAAAGTIEGKADADKIRQWIDEVDRDKLQGWLEGAKSVTAGAAAFAGAQGERLADRAPGAFDKVVGVAKEALGDFIGNEGMAREGELQHLKGDIEERFANAADEAGTKAKGAVDEVRASTEGPDN